MNADEKFKFGPSGPYQCTQKLRIPIGRKGNTLWVDVSIVQAHIPMLLGNNILKPLEAEIKLFSSGNGILVLEDEEIKLKESRAGHYLVDVSDLGKLCYLQSDEKEVHTFQCEICENVVKSANGLSLHMQKEHVDQIRKDIEGELCMDKIQTDLNTLMHSVPSGREKRMIKVMRNFCKLEGIL